MVMVMGIDNGLCLQHKIDILLTFYDLQYRLHNYLLLANLKTGVGAGMVISLHH